MLHLSEHGIYPAFKIMLKCQQYNIREISLFVGLSILALISSWKFMLNCVEHEKSFIASRQGDDVWYNFSQILDE